MTDIDDFDTPNFKPGYCPECGQTTGWLVIKNVWQCDYCNWEGRQPDPRSWAERVQGVTTTEIHV